METEPVLITGASSGIGSELARCFAEAKHPLLLVARRESRLEDLAEELRTAHSIPVEIKPLDLCAPDASEELFDWTQAKEMPIGVLVNNAGFGGFGSFHELEWERQHEMIRLNVGALTELTHRFLPPMQARGRGRILNVASTAAFQPGPLMAVYFATKAYVLSLSEALASELRDQGITVSALCPGPTTSEFGDVAGFPESTAIDRFKMDAARVARLGYRGTMRGKPIIVTGATNWLGTQVIRVAPRALVRRVVKGVNRLLAGGGSPESPRQ